MTRSDTWFPMWIVSCRYALCSVAYILYVPHHFIYYRSLCIRVTAKFPISNCFILGTDFFPERKSQTFNLQSNGWFQRKKKESKTTWNCLLYRWPQLNMKKKKTAATFFRSRKLLWDGILIDIRLLVPTRVIGADI